MVRVDVERVGANEMKLILKAMGRACEGAMRIGSEWTGVV